MEIVKGYYKHFKGGYYLVEGVAIHSETLELFVVYKAQYGERQLFVRPEKMFLEMVEYKETQVPRFKLLEGEELASYLVNDLIQEITDSILGTNDE